MSTKRAVALVGATCLDIINICNQYPDEDSDTRANQQIWQKGGNACNTAEVLTQLNVKCCLMSTIGTKDASGRFILDELKKSGINFQKCSISSENSCPTSTCIISKKNGSRTIVHCRNGLPELTLSDFGKLNFDDFSWIHLEGRGFPDVIHMLKSVAQFKSENSCASLKVSFELEKPRCVSKEIARTVMTYADIVFISKDVARLFGFSNAEDTVINFKSLMQCTDSSSVLICPWADGGCDALDANGNHHHTDALHIDHVVDTLAAGDTLVAGVISQLLCGEDVKNAIQFGCRLASKKCSQQGLENLMMHDIH